LFLNREGGNMIFSVSKAIKKGCSSPISCDSINLDTQAPLFYSLPITKHVPINNFYPYNNQCADARKISD